MYKILNVDNAIVLIFGKGCKIQTMVLIIVILRQKLNTLLTRILQNIFQSVFMVLILQ